MRRAALLAIALALCSALPAAGYDPDAVSSSEPDPATSEPLQSSDAAPVHPPDIYRVTDAYAGDAVLRSGNAISYTTLTTSVYTETYARVLGTVATGEFTSWDSLAFNGRATLTDGRPIAGTFYENFIREGDRFVSWSVVFFQDDRELLGYGVSRSAERNASAASPVTLGRSAEPRALPMLQIGVDPSGGARLLKSLEVARGQRFALRVNVRADGHAATLERWAVVSGVKEASNPAGARAPQQLLDARWDRLPAPGVPWSLTLWARARVSGPSSGVVEGMQQITIWVKAPALVE